MDYLKRKALKIQKRARQRQRIALRIKELRGLIQQGQNVKEAINCLRGLNKNYPKIGG